MSSTSPYCYSCRLYVSPKIVKEEKVTGYIGLTHGHNSLFRPVTNTSFRSVCPKCGGTVHDALLQKAIEKGNAGADKTFLIATLAIVGFVGLVILVLSAGLN